MSAIKFLEDKIKASEQRLEALRAQKNDPEIWAESGFYIQQDMQDETEYCTVLYRKLQRLQETEQVNPIH